MYKRNRVQYCERTCLQFSCISVRLSPDTLLHTPWTVLFDWISWVTVWFMVMICFNQLHNYMAHDDQDEHNDYPGLYRCG